MPYKNKAYKKERQRHLYMERKSSGSCVRCGDVATPGYTFCAACAYKQNLKIRRYYQEHHEELLVKLKMRKRQRLLDNKCGRCGAFLSEEEVGYCFNCRSRSTRSSRLAQPRGVLKYEITN